MKTRQARRAELRPDVIDKRRIHPTCNGQHPAIRAQISGERHLAHSGTDERGSNLHAQGVNTHRGFRIAIEGNPELEKLARARQVDRQDQGPRRIDLQRLRPRAPILSVGADIALDEVAHRPLLFGRQFDIINPFQFFQHRPRTGVLTKKGAPRQIDIVFGE